MKYLLLTLMLGYSLVSHAISLPEVFGNHMVLQQNQAVPIWGKGQVGETVQVQFAQQHLKTQVDKQGRWHVTLTPLTASKIPRELIIAGSETRLVFEDVLVGEVWLSSGQSNMRWPLKRSTHGKRAIKSADNPMLRLLDFSSYDYQAKDKVFSIAALEKLSTSNFFSSSGWQVSSPQSSKNFSAVAYYFADKLQRDLDVPVAMINLSVGGTLMENFISKQRLLDTPSLRGMMDNWLDKIPGWTHRRASLNLSAWLDKYPNRSVHHHFEPSFLFESGIKPLIPFAIAGVIWYQGESNAPSAGEKYLKGFDLALSKLKFKTLIDDWRQHWKQAKLPFLMVQLPGLNRPWPPFRQMQLEVHHETKDTGLVVTTDLGHPTDVHPKDKQPVGQRLANWALANQYHMPVIYRAPFASHARVIDNRLIVEFDLVSNEKTLEQLNSSQIKGVEVSGLNGVFKSVNAKFNRNQLLVNLPGKQSVTAVRYAWFDDPKKRANLVGEDNLPVSPFKFDL